MISPYNGRYYTGKTRKVKENNYIRINNL